MSEEAADGSDFDTTDTLRFNVIPVLSDLAKLWHDSQLWTRNRFGDMLKAMAALGARVDEVSVAVTSLGQTVEALQEQQQGGVPYETSFTEEDAEELRRFTMASLAFIKDAPGDPAVKSALSERGQIVLKMIEENTLSESEDEDDADE